jgi:hypothetical protein
MARSKAVTLEAGALPVFNASTTVTQPVDPAPFSMAAQIELGDDGELKVHGVHVHRAVSPLKGDGLPDGFVMPSGLTVTQR